MNPIRKSIEQRAKKKFNKDKDFYDKNSTLYMICVVIGIIALGLSGLTTFQYFATTIDLFGELVFWNYLLSATLALAQVVIIGFIANSITRDLFRAEWNFMSNVLLIFFIALSGWNIYTDFMGSKDLVDNFTDKPIDLRSAEIKEKYDVQLTAAKNEKKATEDRIKYIKGRCKTDNCLVPGGGAWWQGNMTSHAKKEIRRLESVVEAKSGIISKLQSTLAEESQSANSDYDSELAAWQELKERRTGNFRGIAVVALIFIIATSLYQEYFLAQVAGETGKKPSGKKSSSPTPSSKNHDPDEIQNPGSAQSDEDILKQIKIKELEEQIERIRLNGHSKK